MENNENEMRSIHENVEEQAHVEAPLIDAPAEHTEESVVEPVLEEPVVEAPVVEEPVVEEPVVEEPVVEEPVQSLGFTETGAIGSMAADRPSKKIKPDVDLSEQLALHSTKSVRWEGVGSLSKGYNIVTKAQAEKWLTRGHVRIATPEEVKKAFG
jgi:hypothetical protein